MTLQESPRDGLRHAAHFAPFVSQHASPVMLTNTCVQLRSKANAWGFTFSAPKPYLSAFEANGTKTSTGEQQFRRTRPSVLRKIRATLGAPRGLPHWHYVLKTRNGRKTNTPSRYVFRVHTLKLRTSRCEQGRDNDSNQNVGRTGRWTRDRRWDTWTRTATRNTDDAPTLLQNPNRSPLQGFPFRGRATRPQGLPRWRSRQLWGFPFHSLRKPTRTQERETKRCPLQP